MKLESIKSLCEYGFLSTFRWKQTVFCFRKKLHLFCEEKRVFSSAMCSMHLSKVVFSSMCSPNPMKFIIQHIQYATYENIFFSFQKPSEYEYDYKNAIWYFVFRCNKCNNTVCQWQCQFLLWKTKNDGVLFKTHKFRFIEWDIQSEMHFK